ncbi:hypothetical protein [Streptomyces sp. NPDC005407]|uniref:hypothetical protein n=1 Tax=Streptomyces sp. NPDC005407 TaxID=3155340 RepID=UPI0033A3C1EA
MNRISDEHAPRTPRTETPALALAHEAWRHALLERGMLPFLRRQLPHPVPAPRKFPPSPPAQRRPPRL